MREKLLIREESISKWKEIRIRAGLSRPTREDMIIFKIAYNMGWNAGIKIGKMKKRDKTID